MPVNNAIGTIVLATESHNIDMVFVAGGLRKWQGRLIGHDIDALRNLVRDSRDYVASKVGFDIRPTRKIRAEARRDPAPPRRQLRRDRRPAQPGDVRRARALLEPCGAKSLDVDSAISVAHDRMVSLDPVDRKLWL